MKRLTTMLFVVHLIIALELIALGVLLIIHNITPTQLMTR
jgi:hypothetical protein